MRARPALSVLWGAAVVALAIAFVPVRGLASFQAGLLHPLLIPAHAVALAALGLVIGRRPPRKRGLPIIVFVAGSFAGIGAIAAAFVFTEGALVLLAVAAAAGLSVALNRPAPMLVVSLLSAAAGVALAFDSVPHEISIAATLHALAATAIGAGLLVALVAVSTADIERAWLRIGVRIAGSWIAASAILVLALRLAR